MNDRHHRWWGFRLRSPMGFDNPHVARAEVIAYMACLLIPFLLALYLFRISFGLLIDTKIEFWGTISLCGIAALSGILLPTKLAERLPWVFWFLLARERGNLRTLDFFTLLVLLIAFCFLLIEMGPFPPVSLIGLIGSAASASVVLLLFQKTIKFSSRFTPEPLPEWLQIHKPEATDEQEKPIDEIDDACRPDPDASPMYRYTIKEETTSVGVRIFDETLQKLRDLNTGAKGFLYQQDPATVILVDRGSAEGIGREELIRFTRQIFHCNNQHKLTLLQKANAVLHFIQKRFKYVLDEDSTAGFPGGAFNEYGRFALETIHDQHGDCDCTSILCASLLSYLGYDVALLFMKIADPDTDEECGHCAVGLNAENTPLAENAAQLGCFKSDDGTYYLYGETATDNIMAFGLIPEGFEDNILEASRKVVKIPQIEPVTINPLQI